MILQVQRDRWTCLATAFAMCWELPVDGVLSKLPDAGTIAWPGNDEAMSRRGHHIMELCQLGLEYGFGSMVIDNTLALGDPMFQSDSVIRIDNSHVIRELLAKFDGVVSYTCPLTRHAVAWDSYEQIALNPNGSRHKLTGLHIESFTPVWEL